MKILRRLFKSAAHPESASAAQSMTVYSGIGYGNGTLFVTPGSDRPDVPEWIRTTAAGISMPVMLTVKFNGGAAVVPSKLADYLITNRLASAVPVPIPMPLIERAVAPMGERMKYPAPIEVGRPISEYADLVRQGRA